MRYAMCVWLAALSCVLFPGAARGESVTWGITGGLVASTIRVGGAGAFDTSMKGGGAIGGSVTLRETKRIGVRGELLATWRMFDGTVPGTSFAVSSRSFEIPVLVRIRLTPAARAGAWIDAGPEFARILSVTQQTGSTRIDIGNEIKDIDLAVVVGGGFDFRVGRPTFELLTRAVIGLRQLSESAGQTSKSRAVTVLAGYRF